MNVLVSGQEKDAVIYIRARERETDRLKKGLNCEQIHIAQSVIITLNTNTTMIRCFFTTLSSDLKTDIMFLDNKLTTNTFCDKF